MKHKLLLIYAWSIRIILFPFPDIPIIMRFRGFLYSLGMKSCGRNFQVSHDVIINGLEGLSVGDDVFINNYNVLLSTYGIHIDSEVIIGPSCVFSANNHLPKNKSFRYGDREINPIYIGRGTWVASNCTVTSGSYIPNFSLIAAGAVYTLTKEKAIFEGSIYGGVPAKFIKHIQ